MWSIKPQTIYIRADLKLEFQPRRMNQAHHFLLDVTHDGVTRRVRFSPSGEALRVETLPTGLTDEGIGRRV